MIRKCRACIAFGLDDLSLPPLASPPCPRTHVPPILQPFKPYPPLRFDTPFPLVMCHYYPTTQVMAMGGSEQLPPDASGKVKMSFVMPS